MGWATGHIAKLQQGETVSFRPRGHSMEPKISSGQLCTVEPIEDHGALSKGEIVLCKVRGRQYLHLIKAIQGDRFQIGNNQGLINGWIGSSGIFGRLIKVED
ncbi:MAG: S24/S26 family peptidase [Myxococcota bacterium]